MYGKAITHLLRLSSIIQTLEDAFKILESLNHDPKDKLSTELKTAIEDHIGDNKYNIMEVSAVENAEKLVHYFNAHRLAMAGYDIVLHSPTTNCKSIVEELINKMLVKSNSSVQSKFTDEQIKIFKIILLQPGSEIDSSVINQKKRISSEILSRAFKELEKQHLGLINEKKPLKGPSKLIFQKLKPDKLIENVNCVNVLETMDIDIDSYTAMFNKQS